MRALWLILPLITTACSREDASNHQPAARAKANVTKAVHRVVGTPHAFDALKNENVAATETPKLEEISSASAEEEDDRAVTPPLPRFEDYAIARSTIHVPLVLAKGTPDWDYRTRLREADREAPNFSSNGVIVLWGCGTQCATGAWIDRTAGKIGELPVAGEDYLELDLESRAGSNLVLSTWLDPKPSKPFCLFGAHVWSGKAFKAIRGYPIRVPGQCPVNYMYR